MYADDTHLTFACNSIETINDVMNRDLSNVNKWLVANKLTLNSSKTGFMLVGSRQRLGTYNTSPNLTIIMLSTGKVKVNISYSFITFQHSHFLY